jgi:hypothetical protein
MDPDQLGKNVYKIISQWKKGGCNSACHPNHSRKCKIGGSQSRPALAKSETLSPK